MKFVFKDLGSIKKEALKLHKFAKSRGLKSKLSLAQNVIASSYGWKHFNEMSSFHDRIRRNEVAINVPERQILPTHKHQYDGYLSIEIANDLQKKTLDGRKHLFVEKYLASLGLNEHVCNEVAKAFFSSAGMIKKMFTASHLEVNALNDIPIEQVKRGVVAKLNNAYDSVEVYSEMCIPRLIDDGGVMILNRYVAEKIIPHLLKFNDQSRVVSVIDMSYGKFQIESIDVERVVIDPLAYNGKSYSPISISINALIARHQESLLRQTAHEMEIEGFDSVSASILSDFLKEVGMKIELETDYEADFLRETNALLRLLADKEKHQAIQKAVNQGGDENCSDFQFFLSYLNKYVMSLHDRKEHPYLVRESPFLGICLDAFLLLLRHKNSIDRVQGDVSASSQEKELIERFYDGDIIIAVVDSNVEESVYLSRIFMSLCRHYIVPLLGHPVEGHPVEAKSDIIEPKPSFQRQFVIDVPECLPLGSTMFFVQARYLGIKWLINFPHLHRCHELEYSSIIANASVFILSKLITDEKDSIIRETKMYESSKELRELLMLQLSSGFDSLHRENKFAVIFVSHLSCGEREWRVDLVDKCKAKNY